MRAAFLLLGMMLSGSASHAATVIVYVYNTEFSLNPPGQPVVSHITINQGDIVRWQNMQGSHTTTSVSASAEQWNANLSNSNPVYERQFNNVGVFHYYCIPHGGEIAGGTLATGMSGSITVISANAGACCLPNGSCILTDQGGCVAQSGIYQGNGTSCSPNPCVLGPVTVTLQASKDNTIYSEAATSNGGGASLFVGIRQQNTRRSLLQFDLSAIPSGASITSAELRMNATTVNGTHTLSVQALLATWGEGSAAGVLNIGATPATGDATWTHRLHSNTLWSTAGGQFEPEILATAAVSAVGQATWNSPAFLADVIMRHNMPNMNWGWILRSGAEGPPVTNNTNVTFASRENGTVASRPRLVITYMPPAPQGACCMPNGGCSVNTQGQCTAMGGIYHGDGSECDDVYCPIALTPFMDPLPLPGVAQPLTGSPGAAAHYDIAITEQFQQLHSQLAQTRTWGYAGSYPGPTIEARRGQPVTVQWRNDLRVAETGQLRTQHAMFVDECLHGPDHTGQTPVTVVHLHGGKVSSFSDGPPDSTFAPGQSASDLYVYPNKQQAATLWYHDHALGLTRLNVMMGLAGFYLIRDEVEDGLGLPSGEYEIPMAVQDRQFNFDGSFRYPEMAMDEFFGDKMLVNGKVWPYLNVKQGKYRFRMVNGCNSRTLTLALSNGATFHQVGTDGGLLPAPIPRTSVTFLPGERVDLVFDFAGYAPGTEIILTNSAPAPFPGFPGVGVLPNVMKFIVQGQPGYTAPLPTSLAMVPPIPVGEASIERLLELKTIPMTCALTGHTHLVWTINGLLWNEITETPRQSATEIWTFKNNSGISHPMHLHLEFGQLLNRQAIDDVTGQPTGPLLPPAPNELGWKDTWDAPPGYFTRILMRFDASTGTYPYHCHILEHEDHEMMRQFTVINPVRVAVRVMLDGPFDPVTGLMRDGLRTEGFISLKEPYSDLGFDLKGGSGAMITTPQLAEGGVSALVDWVLVELRSAIDPTLVLRTRTALVRRDGQVVASDGSLFLNFDVPEGNYHIAVRHRNHLGAMTAVPVTLTDIIETVDFTQPSMATYGTEARRVTDGVARLWCGDVLSDGILKYLGSTNDRDPMLVRVGSSDPVNVVNGFYPEDITLDGWVKYVGSDNDRDALLISIGGEIPTNVRFEQLP